MHESRLFEELLDEVSRPARQEAMKKIMRIRVNPGEDSHINPESLHFHFERKSRGGPTEESTLEIQATAGDSFFLVSVDRE